MIFNSISYLLFLSLAVIAYYMMPGKRRWIWLLIASVAYYLSFIPVFFGLLALLVVSNYFLSIWMGNHEKSHRKKPVTLIIIFNILILIFFKYFNFIFPDFQVNLYRVDYFYRVDPINRMIIPLGLSYIVFTILSYQIEIKRNTISPERNFGFYSLYLLFFPKIAQGPIERPKTLLTQIREPKIFDYSLVSEGLKLIVWGYFKKLVVADRLALYVNAVYGNAEHHNGTTLLLATFFYAIQIYADFSGYTDIALGSASLFGFKLTNNFNRPYFATSIKDFWNRWHISFSTWLRDYLFLPLAFYFSNKLKKPIYFGIKTEKWIYLFAIMITFSICGLWHGEGLNFLVWGMLFGLYLTFANWTEKSSRDISKMLKINKSSKYFEVLQIITTFILVCFAWIFFRAQSLSEALNIIKAIFTSPGMVFYDSPAFLIYAFIGLSILLFSEINWNYFNGRYSLLVHKSSFVRYFGYAAIIISIVLIGVLDGGQFIYFQF